MDFFAQQDRVHRRTKWLVAYFVLAVTLIILLIYGVVLIGYHYAQESAATRQKYYHDDDPQVVPWISPQPVPWVWWHPQAFLGATLGTLAVILLGSAWKINQLSAGGGSVATLMGGRRVNPNTRDANERKLLNVVEEMAIASGVPMPEVYVLEREPGINAFAAGHTTGDAAIGVTRGCIEMLSRDELQGVIGHEFSHILNGDMRLNLRLIGIIFGLLCLATLGRVLLYMRSGNSRDRNPLPLLGLILILLGSIGVFFGRLIQAAISRQREFLADASSVQFTRNPAGLSGALQKIGRFSFGSKLQSEHAPDMCHMFFGNGLGSPLFRALATHPPIADRIRAIDPAWDGKFPALQPQQVEVVKQAALSELRHPFPSKPGGLFGAVLTGAILSDNAADTAARPPTPPVPPVLRPETVLPNLGNPTPLHLQYAETLRESLPEKLRDAAHTPLSATALIYALLLAGEEKLRAEQLAEIARRASPAVSEQTAALAPEVAATARRARLPLVNLALGSLGDLTDDQFQSFSQTLDWLVDSDGQLDLFEFVLQKIVRHHLAAKFGSARPPAVQYYAFKPLAPDCGVILSALAWVGSEVPAEVQKAFATGLPYLRPPAGLEPALLPLAQCGVAALDSALDRLALAAPILKKNLIEAATRVIGADGVILEAEAELLRAVADTLDCPIPPLI